MKSLSAGEVHALKVAELGLDPAALDLTSTEAIANALRRASSLLCPCTATTLVRAVVRPMEYLVPSLEATKESVAATLDAMISHGDLLEQQAIDDEVGGRRGVLVYAAPPSFVLRQSGAALVLGIAPDQFSPLPHEVESRVEYANHVRRLPADAVQDLRSYLTHLGYVELSLKAWSNVPPSELPAHYAKRMESLIENAPASSADIPGLTLLDPELPVNYYRGRWTIPGSMTGRYVARRSQAYGADLWCYVQIRNGIAERHIDLPLAGSRLRGCDEAWRLQMAIDAARGKPQRFKICNGPEGAYVFEFYSPVPMWAVRRWNVVGEPVLRSQCLFAYKFAASELQEELRFIREMLWLEETY